MEDKKSFFRERTKAEIARLDANKVSTENGLVKRILDLNPEQGLIVNSSLTPQRFFNDSLNGQEASLKCYRHGDLISLSQPRAQWRAYECKETPVAIRKRDFSKLGEMEEQDINFVGYSFYPVQGERRKRIVPFVWILEGARLFAYAETMTQGIKVEPYPNSRRVKYEGADIICTVPSRTPKKPRYRVRLKHAPVEGSTERRAVAWSLTTNMQQEDIPHRDYDIRYTYENQREGSDIFRFYPHDIASYYAVIKHFAKDHNITPLEMSPLAIPSRMSAEFYNRLNNNVLVYDPTLKSKDNLRKPHLDEKSILIARMVGVYGHDATMFADGARDGKLQDYEWKV
jgi:hypothetical protein